MASTSTPQSSISPDAFVKNSPLFKLPPELRNRIYRYVFGSGEAITPARPQWSSSFSVLSNFDEDFVCDEYIVENPVHFSILSASRFLKAEAIEVLYGEKILRGDTTSLDRMLQSQDVYTRAKRLEITDSDKVYHRNEGLDDYHAFLKSAQQMPSLHSIVILSDCLVNIPQRPAITVTNFVSRLCLGKATCIDIGRYQLYGVFKDVQIVHRQLVQMWPDVRATPKDYDGVSDALATIDGLHLTSDPSNVLTWASHISLRCWVDIQQQFLELLRSGKWAELLGKVNTGTLDQDAENLTVKVFFSIATWSMRLSLKDCRLLWRGKLVFRELQPHDDSQLLAGVSEFLALNIVGYYRERAHPAVVRSWDQSPIVWANDWEDTGKTTLQYMAEQQAIALSGGSSVEFVLDPALRCNISANRLISTSIAKRWIEDTGLSHLLPDDSAPALPQTLKQLTHLAMALSHYNLHNVGADRDYHRRRDRWSGDLLLRYIIASGDLNRRNRLIITNASIGDLRTIVSTALAIIQDGRLECKKFAGRFVRYNRLPVSFDNNVLPALGWTYGKLFAQTFHKYYAQGSLSRTLADAWVTESTLLRE